MRININNIALNYQKKGSGDPLILLHGNGEDLHIFDELIAKLEKHFTVYAIDSRNHGGSSRTDDYTYESMAEDIHQFINVLNLKKPSVIGFSDGAIISTLIELKYPLTFSRMALLGVNLSPNDFKPEVYNYILEEYNKTKSPLYEMMLEQPNIKLEDLKNIETPTLVVGAEDDLYVEGFFENVTNAIPNSKLLIIEGHDHGSYIINTDALFSHLGSFLGY